MTKNKKIDRKSFIKKVALGSLATSGLLSSCNKDSKIETPNIKTNQKYKWKMVTTWPPNFPVVGEGCNHFAEMVYKMSGGRMEIKVYGGGELVPALEIFEAVSSGAAEMGHGASYYWAGKIAASQMFTTIPFGMNAQQMNAWLYDGGGLELWEELYAKYNLLPMPGGNTGVQMAGWFNREINTIEDFRGLKMRIPGLGGKVVEKAGGAAVLSAGSEIYTNLERGVIDATEWIGPYHDYKMGFHKIAKYYYSPGWHEPGSTLEIIYNKSLFDKMPQDIQEILRSAAYRCNMWMLSVFESKNNEYLKKITDESDVEIRTLAKPVLQDLRKFTDEVIAEITSRDKESAKIYASYDTFRNQIHNWARYSEKLYHELIS